LALNFALHRARCITARNIAAIRHPPPRKVIKTRIARRSNDSSRSLHVASRGCFAICMDLGQVPPLNVEQKPRKWKVKAKSFPLAQKVFREAAENAARPENLNPDGKRQKLLTLMTRLALLCSLCFDKTPRTEILRSIKRRAAEIMRRGFLFDQEINWPIKLLAHFARHCGGNLCVAPERCTKVRRADHRRRRRCSRVKRD
jgi:hypothetical protein